MIERRNNYKRIKEEIARLKLDVREICEKIDHLETIILGSCQGNHLQCPHRSN